MLKPQSTKVISPVMPLASGLGRGVTGDVLFVDAGFHLMGL